MRVEGVVKLFERPFVVTDALAHVMFLFEMEHCRLRLLAHENVKNSNPHFFLRRSSGLENASGHRHVQEHGDGKVTLSYVKWRVVREKVGLKACVCRSNLSDSRHAFLPQSLTTAQSLSGRRWVGDTRREGQRSRGAGGRGVVWGVRGEDGLDPNIFLARVLRIPHFPARVSLSRPLRVGVIMTTSRRGPAIDPIHLSWSSSDNNTATCHKRG